MRKILSGKPEDDSAEDAPEERLAEVVSDEREDAETPAAEVAQTTSERDKPVDYTKLNEYVDSILAEAKVAAAEIKKEARKDAERLRERADQEATRLTAANREAAKLLAEAERLRAEAEAAGNLTRDRAEVYADEKRRETEVVTAEMIATAQQTAARRAQETGARTAELQENFELTVQRLIQLAGGLREVAAGLEELVPVKEDDVEQSTPTPPPPSRLKESLVESLRATIATQESGEPGRSPLDDE